MQEVVRAKAQRGRGQGAGPLVIPRASGVDLPEKPRRSGQGAEGGFDAGSLADMVKSRPSSPDPRHTRPKRRKTGGWPEIPPSKSFTLWVPNEHEEKLRELAHKKGCSVATLIRQAIAEMLEDGQDRPRRSRDDSRSASVPGAAKARPVRAVRQGASA